jgi:Fe-S-cluster containining protein
MQYVGITRHTPQKEVIQAGNCHRDCPSCQHLCKVGSGFLADSDFAPLAKHLGVSEEKLKQDYLESVELYNKTLWRPKLLREGKPYGQCVFYNEQEKCTVHVVKPLQCRTSSCKPGSEQLTDWFLLNHAIDATDPVAVREWASTMQVRDTIPGGKLRELITDKEMLKKIMSYELVRKK